MVLYIQSCMCRLFYSCTATMMVVRRIHWVAASIGVSCEGDVDTVVMASSR